MSLPSSARDAGDWQIQTALNLAGDYYLVDRKISFTSYTPETGKITKTSDIII